MSAPSLALAIDASEWFHDVALCSALSPRHWRRLPARSEVAVRRAFAACREAGVLATWFVTGELAARAPELLRELVAAGQEVALAALAPTPLDEVPAHERDALVAAWERSLAAVEGVTGRAVVGFRGVWAVRAADGWWSERLRALGLGYDATPRAGEEASIVRALAATGAARATTFAAWRLDADAPRLAGLPHPVAAAHYGRLAGADGDLRAALAGARGPIAAGLGIAAMPAPARPPRASEPRTAARSAASRLAIVVPLKDEAAGIASLALELDALAHDLADVAACEFVFVDDGSTDDTWALLGRHFGTQPHARLVRHEHNRGVAAAIATGIRATDAALVASIDGDLSYDPRELRAMLALAATGADVVTASPYHPRGGVKNVPGWRLLLSRTLSAAYRLLLWSPVRTWTSCFRVYRRAAVVDLPLANERFLGTAELLVRVLRRGGRVVEHPCVLEARLFGVSKLKVARTVLGHLRLLVAVAFRVVR